MGVHMIPAWQQPSDKNWQVWSGGFMKSSTAQTSEEQSSSDGSSLGLQNEKIFKNVDVFKMDESTFQSQNVLKFSTIL